LSMRPHCPFLNLMVGISYCCAASQRTAGCLHDLVSSGLHYVQEYRRFALLALSTSGNQRQAEEAWIDATFASHDAGRESGVASSGLFHAAASTVGAKLFTHAAQSQDQSAFTVSYADAKRLEVDYNTARVLQYLNLHYLCAPMYEALISTGKRLLQQPISVPPPLRQQEKDGHIIVSSPLEVVSVLVQSASINLYVLYSGASGNGPLAVSWLPKL
jgi:hypothetical protein